MRTPHQVIISAELMDVLEERVLEAGIPDPRRAIDAMFALEKKKSKTIGGPRTRKAFDKAKKILLKRIAHQERALKASKANPGQSGNDPARAARELKFWQDELAKVDKFGRSFGFK